MCTSCVGKQGGRGGGRGQGQREGAGQGEREKESSMMTPLATSFTGKYGSIQYFVKAILERPVAPSQIVQREFQVISHIDVNSPVLLAPARQCQEKMVGCWFFTSGPVSLSAKIERKGYCNGEAIPIYAEIENCSSRLIVPKAAIFQTQTYLASGRTKTFRQMVANVRGNHVASGSTDTWNGKTLKIPPVTPSILDCCIIRVDYSLAVYIHIPGAKKLMLELPLVIGTIPCTAFSSRNSSLISQFSVDMSWLALTMPEHPEAPPNYADIVSEEEFSRHVTAYPPPVDCDEQLCCPMFAYIQEFRFQPPPLYSEKQCSYMKSGIRAPEVSGPNTLCLFVEEEEVKENLVNLLAWKRLCEQLLDEVDPLYFGQMKCVWGEMT
ncbi:hypothetical protein JD844_014629 [Phrynosoma platyrhinos]|uniref:Arrestin C-terminal-like domain-containing protein n=1 Tax=Phrynosoma platyrhinos TaxID=52577 RepID=A0ABQ7SRZ0_PHRPL|nr:hypothetical protein JD844_014629 [Phrynosoma platyrhinos]